MAQWSYASALTKIAAYGLVHPNMGELMRNLKLTVIVDPDLRGILEAGAEREGRSISNYTRRLIDRAAREAVRAEPIEQRETTAA